MTSVKKVKVALLALVAALVIALPTAAFAADNTVAVTGPEGGHTYEAYQILTGTITEDGKLATPQWGESIDQTKLEGAFENSEVFAGVTNAADVATLLSDENSAEFAKLIEGALKDEAFKTFTSETKDYSVELPDGYYLIKDEAGSLDGEHASYTLNIITLIGDEESEAIVAKADTPEVKKQVKEDATEEWGKTGDFDIDQAIDYRLIGTLSAKINDYDTYTYNFVDTMTNLTMDDPVAVTVYAAKVTLDEDGYPASEFTDEKPLTTYQASFSNGVLRVDFEDIKADLIAAGAVNGTLVDTDYKIIVEYQARLTPDCVIGDPGNPNEVYLEFSNNPYNDGEGDNLGKTPEDYCVVFTYKLDNLKTGQGADANGLANAKFVLQNADTEKYYKVTDGKVSWVEDQADATEITTPANGKFSFVGLDEGNYTLIETEAPGDYVVIDPINFTINASTSYDKNTKTGKIDTLTMPAIEHASVSNAVVEQTENEAGEKTGYTGTLKFDIANTTESTLPSTGGIGTTIFTIVGIALIVAAAAIMVVRRRNAAAIQ